jgi:hypothetical protein
MKRIEWPERILGAVIVLVAIAAAAPASAQKICINPATGRPTYYPADQVPPDCGELVMPLAYRCDQVNGLPHCNPPVTLKLPKVVPSSAPPALAATTTQFGGTVKRNGETYWLWNANGSPLYMTTMFFQLTVAPQALPAPPSALAEQVTMYRVTDMVEPGYVFVFLKLPLKTPKVIVNRTRALNVSRPVFVTQAVDGSAVVKIPADILGKPDDQYFEIALRSQDTRPYTGPAWVSALSKIRLGSTVVKP